MWCSTYQFVFGYMLEDSVSYNTFQELTGNASKTDGTTTAQAGDDCLF